MTRPGESKSDYVDFILLKRASAEVGPHGFLLQPAATGSLTTGRTITSLTIIAIAVVLVGAATRLGLPGAIALGAATSTGAALIVSDRVVVPMFAGVAIAVLGTAIARLLILRNSMGPRADPRSTGLLALLLFGIWATFITAIAPLMFQGLNVLASTGPPVPLGSHALLTLSNIAQLAYLWIGIGTTLLLSRMTQNPIIVIEIALASATILNVWALVHSVFGVPFPERFFDNSPNFDYISSAADGSPRFRGITSEPSALASIANPMIVFAVAAFPSASNRRRVWLAGLGACALWLGILSTSTSFIVSNVAIAVLAVLIVVGRLAFSRVQHPRAVWVGAAFVTLSLVLAMPTILKFIGTTFGSKVESTSFAVRSGADQFSLQVALQSFGLGVGVGANRASSFVASLLSQTGVPGFVLFAVAVCLIMRSASTDASVRPVLWVALSFFVGRAFNGPDVGDSTGITWLLLGVLANSEYRRVVATSPLSAQTAVRRSNIGANLGWQR